MCKKYLIEENKDIESELDLNKNTIEDVKYFTTGSKNILYLICNKCKSEYDRSVQSYTRGSRCPYCAGKKFNYTNSLASTKAHLVELWDFELNKELTPYNVAPYSNKKVWWKCQKCNQSYDMTINHKSKGVGCPYCSGRRSSNDNSLATRNPKLVLEWHPTKNGDLTPIDVTHRSSKKVWWICSLGHEWYTAISLRNRGEGSKCPYCVSRKLLIGFNDMWTTNPELAKLLANPEDGYKYMQSSNKRVDWKCRDCGEIIHNKKISDIKNYGLSCPSCSDGVSYSEKVLYNLLILLGVEFESEYSFKGFKIKRYDFYIPILNCIIETHGKQHLNGGFSTLGGKTSEEERENDRVKREIALNNNIKHYIELDCRESNIEYIRNSILNSELVYLLDLTNIDWNCIALKAEKSLVVEASKLWNDGIKSTKMISEILGISQTTSIDYLKRMSKLNKCDYLN